MKILVGNKGNVDFDFPVKMSKQQQEKFFELMEKLFAVVEIREGEEFRTERLGEKHFQRKWTKEERRILLETDETEKVAEKLGRTWMSVDIQRGDWVPNFINWTNSRGYDIIAEIREGNVKKYIEEFLEYKEEKKRKRREQRKKRKNKLEYLKQKREAARTELKSIKLRKKCGAERPGDDKRIRKKKRKITELEQKINSMKN